MYSTGDFIYSMHVFDLVYSAGGFAYSTEFLRYYKMDAKIAWTFGDKVPGQDLVEFLHMFYIIKNWDPSNFILIK